MNRSARCNVDPRTDVATTRQPTANRLRILGQRLTAPARRIGRWFAHQPRAIQIGLVGVLLAALGTSAYYAQSYLKKRNTARAVGAAWGEFTEGLRKRNLDTIRAGLDGVLAVEPADPTALRFKAMLEREEADADTPDLAAVFLIHHLKNRRLPEAAREAEIVLAHNPKDWQARCAVADHALQVLKDRARAESHLAQLPDPEDPAAHTLADGLHYAIQLSNRLGRDATPLRRLIVRRLVPGMHGGTALNSPPATRYMLVECYLTAFADPGSWTELADSWAAADRLADSAVNEAVAAGDVPLLIRLATLGPRMRAALAVLRDNDPTRLPADRLQPLVNAVDDRTRRAWEAVREKDPGRVEAYIGLANLAFLENKPDEALARVMDGLAACGDRVELLELLPTLGVYVGTDEGLRKTVQSLWTAAETARTDPAKWALAARVAVLAHQINGMYRIEPAFYACQQARAIRADYGPACRIEAWLWLRNGNFLRAREALLPLGEVALRTDPELVQMHARALAETLWVLIDNEFNAVLEAQEKLKPKTSVPALAFLVGVLKATPTEERMRWVAERAALVAARDQQAPAARRLRFEALYRLAEFSVTTDPRGGPPVWDTSRVATALRAFEELSPDERTLPAAVASLAALQLKGQGNAAAAMRTIAPLRGVEGSLATGQLEVLGAILAANGQAAEAVRVLERAEKMPGASAGLRIALAVAYHKNRQPADRDAALLRLENSLENSPTRTAREQAELVAAKLLFEREKP